MSESSPAFRRFVDAIGLDETVETIRDLLAAETSRETARSTNAAITGVKEGQEKVELLTILIVTLYGIQLLDLLLARLARAPKGIVEIQFLCGVGIIIALLTLLGLRRQSHTAAKAGIPYDSFQRLQSPA